jgi:hypothetical protein
MGQDTRDAERRRIVEERRIATCPTCRQTGEFVFLGEQHWPAEVAAKLGLPSIILLYSCECCQTTVSEPDLLPARPGAHCHPETKHQYS